MKIEEMFGGNLSVSKIVWTKRDGKITRQDVNLREPHEVKARTKIEVKDDNQ